MDFNVKVRAIVKKPIFGDKLYVEIDEIQILISPIKFVILVWVTVIALLCMNLWKFFIGLN